MKFATLPCSLMLAAGPGAARAAESASAVFDRYVAAVHAGDIGAVRALIAPGVERSDFVGCRPEMDNGARLAQYIEVTVVGPKARFMERSRRLDGDTLIAEIEVRSPLFAQAGVERIVGRGVLTVRDEPTAAFFATLGSGPRAAKNVAAPRT